MTKPISLTGIKPTGAPHIGNLLGAIKPALDLAKSYDARYFLADIHALNTIKDGALLKQYTLEIAATWIALGLDHDDVIFYKQSDVPEISELATILMSFTSKGLMNRAHAYKARVQENLEADRDPDFSVNMGLFTYPVLMAADILTFMPDVVPVGKDQLQHLEMCIDIAQSFNSAYGPKPLVKIPKPLVDEKTMVIPGIDGRKMSKSYNNTIPIFLPEKELKRLINKIKTNSQSVEEPKEPDSCPVFNLYRYFASPDEIEALKKRYRQGGMGWGEAKASLFEVINRYIEPFRARYADLLNDPSSIEVILEDGGKKARHHASKNLATIKRTIGLI